MSTIKDTVAAELQDGLQTILQLQQQGQLNKAIEVSLKLLNLFPQYNPLIQNTALLFLHSNQPAKALEFLQTAINNQPRQALPYNYAGIALCQLGKIDEGISYYRKALKYDSTLKEALLNLGIALIEKEDFAKAETYLQKAEQAKLLSPVLFYNLGYLEYQKKNLTQAINYYQKALALEPTYLKCAINLGEALFEADHAQEANQIFAQLVKILPEDKNIHKKLGATFLKLSRFEDAVFHLNKGFDPSQEDIFIYLAGAYASLKDIQKEYEILLQGLEHFPYNPTLLITLITLCRNHSLWEKYDEMMIRIKKIIPNQDYLFKYPSYYILDLSLQEEQLFSRKIAAYFKEKVSLKKSLCNFSFKRETKSILKIGYLSGNISNHPNSHMIANIFNTHSRDGFEFYLYGTEKPDNSDFAHILMTTPDHFTNLAGMDSVEAAKIIYKDKIDILVDLSAYHRILSSEILALRPAPLVIGFLGHCGTRGSDYIDYIMTDKTVTLPEDIQYYDEKLIFLPNTHWVTNDQQAIAAPCSREAFNLPEDKFIFTCFNLNIKYEPTTFASWMRILNRVPDSVLLLWARAGRDNLKHYAEQQGVDPDRILFADGLEKSVHLSRLQLLDLFIDSFHCSAHCTAIDALWANLPIVTLYGQNVAERGCSSILKAHGMDELITYSIEEYEAKAIELANQPELLASIRAKIAVNKTAQPLFNTKQFTTHLEKAYTLVHDHYLSGKLPEQIILD